MWNVRLYYHTHLNTLNVLDNGDKLETADYIDLPPVDILQAEGLNAITVRATRAQVKNVEYVKLTDQDTGDFYYYEAGIPVPSSKDVQTIPLTCDAMLTLADIYDGVENIPFLDGIVTRHHVAKANDTYGAYTEEDPMLIPSKELDMDIIKLFDDNDDDQHIIVESTIALDAQADHYKAHVYTDDQSGNEVTVPTVVPVASNTEVWFGDTSEYNTYRTPGTEYFDAKKTKVKEGIAAVRGLGVESGILNSYVLPASQAVFEPADETGQITQIAGAHEEANSTMHFEYANVDNKRVLYGALNSLELISVASGMRASFKPEDLQPGETGDAPTVVKITDPRPSGRPYFMFKYFKGTENETNFANAVAGMEWANAPLVYTGKSGSTLDQINLATTLHGMSVTQGEMEYQNGMMPLRALAGLTSQAGSAALSGIGGGGGVDSRLSSIQAAEKALYAQRGAVNQYLGAQNTDDWFRAQMEHQMGAAMMASDHALENMNAAMNASPSGAGLGGAIGGVTNLALAGVDYFHNKEYLKEQYGARMSNELAQFATGQIAAPALNFPRSETLRDFIGNGVFVVRYKPRQSDIEKLDRILTMYGYKDTIPLIGGQSVLNNRSKFNFVQIKGCSIGGNTPRWLREAAAAQLSVGVRIWHELPNREAYNPGQNV